MAQNITLLGASYSAVPAVTLPKTGGGTARFDDCTVVTAAASDVASGKIFVASDGTITTGTNSGGGGGGIATLLATKSLGTVNVTSTTAQSLGVDKNITIADVDDYDALFVWTSVNSITNGRHVGTGRLMYFTITNGAKNGSQFGYTYNYKISSSGVYSATAASSAYGVYPYSLSWSMGTGTMQMYGRYSSSTTTTINGDYTARVYGMKFLDMVGG